MKRPIVAVLLPVSAVLLAVLMSAAQAAPGDRFNAAISPVAVQPHAGQTYSVQLTNLGSSADSADNAHVTVPVGFVVDESTLSASVAAHGGCSAATWTAALNLVTSSIDAAAADASGDLCPGATLTIGFSATAPLAQGVYEWTSTLLDADSPFTLQSSQPTVTVDGTPPPPPDLTATPPDPSGSSTATFGFSDDDATATFSCQLDGGAFAPCSSPETYTGLGEGGHTFSVVAVDAAGNQSSATSYGWTIDLTPPPSPTLTSEPPSVTASTDASFSFVDGDATATFRCRLDGAAFAACTSPIAYHGLAEGSHTFDVQAVDPAGNESTTTAYTWTIDLTNPVVTIDPASEPPDPTNHTTANFVFTSNKAGSRFECRLDTDVFTTCETPQAYSGLGNGRHRFGVRATDPAGNVGLPTEYEWTVEDTSPPGTVTGLKRRVGYRLLRLTWSLPADSDFDHIEVMRSRNAKGAARAVVYDGTATGYTDKRFQNGTYYRYVVVAYDRSGNGSAGVRVVVPPSVLLRSPRDGGVVRRPPLLLWSGVPRATYYNVQVFHGSHKVLSAWPSKARLRMRSSWVYQGHTFRLRKGGYRWWVWPAFGPRSKAAYGQLLGTGTFVVR